MERAAVLVLRVSWLALPLAFVPAVGGAIEEASGPVRLVALIGLWSLWPAGLAASLVPSPVSLTLVRLVAPAPLAVALIALVADPGRWAVAAAALGAVVVVAAFHRGVGKRFVQAAAYGDEARYPLRPPGQLVLGPLPALWLLLAAAVAGGPLLLAARQWVAGIVVTVVAVGLLAVLPLRFHRLSDRFLVFVPAGLVVHDSVALAQTAMTRWAGVRDVSRALAGTDALDLTAGALGPAMEVSLLEALPVLRAGRRPGTADLVPAAAFLCSPTMLSEALAEAGRRRARAGRLPRTLDP